MFLGLNCPSKTRSNRKGGPLSNLFMSWCVLYGQLKFTSLLKEKSVVMQSEHIAANDKLNIISWINSEKTAKIRYKFLTWWSRQMMLKDYQFSLAKIKFYLEMFIFNILISNLSWKRMEWSGPLDLHDPFDFFKT